MKNSIGPTTTQSVSSKARPNGTLKAKSAGSTSKGTKSTVVTGLRAKSLGMTSKGRSSNSITGLNAPKK